MTATERLFRANKDEYLSMDDVRDYGKIIYQLTFKEAINSKPPIISDYRIITFGISEPEIEEIYQDNKFLQVKKELKDITAREFATALALRKAIKDLKITNAISFHSSIKRAVNFKDQQSLITKKYAGEEVPLPANWGGWRVAPETVEFWQGRRSRLHDRLRFRRGKDGEWSVERLAP